MKRSDRVKASEVFVSSPSQPMIVRGCGRRPPSHRVLLVRRVYAMSHHLLINQFRVRPKPGNTYFSLSLVGVLRGIIETSLAGLRRHTATAPATEGEHPLDSQK